MKKLLLLMVFVLMLSHSAIMGVVHTNSNGIGYCSTVADTKQELLTGVDRYNNSAEKLTIQKTISSASVFVDNAVEEPELLLAVLQTSEATKKFHLFSHGRSGELLINSKWLNAKEIANFLISEFKIQNTTLTDLNIYGCEFAKGVKGKQAVTYLENVLGISVNASTNITGKDGDWVLEVGNGEIQNLNSYSYNLQCANQGTGKNEDFDCDGVLNLDDFDDDGDGILDRNECEYADKTFNYHLFDAALEPDDNLDAYLGFGIGEGSTSITNGAGDFGSSTVITDASNNLAYDDGNWYVLVANGSGTLLYHTDDIVNTPFTSLGNANVSSDVDNLAYDKGVFYHLKNVGEVVKLYSSQDPVNSGWTLLGNTSLEVTKMDGFAVYDGLFLALDSSTGAQFSQIAYVTTTPLTTAAWPEQTYDPSNTSGIGLGTNVANYSLGSIPHQYYDCDNDSDGILNQFDLDSDADGCPDAVEGDSNHVFTDLINNFNIAGGSTNVYYNLEAPSNIYGVPGNAYQNIGSSQNNTVQSIECDACNSASTLFVDSDNDSIGDACDLDNDNDGILDTDECLTPAEFSGGIATQSSDYGASYLVAFARDGNTSSLSHTIAEDNPWWVLDMGASIHIKEIQVYNRTNCCV